MAELRTRHKLELSSKEDEVAKRMADKERQLQQVYSRYGTLCKLNNNCG
jgi:hypothetical protein